MSLFLLTLEIPLKPLKVTKYLSKIDILGGRGKDGGGEGGVNKHKLYNIVKYFMISSCQNSQSKLY